MVLQTITGAAGPEAWCDVCSQDICRVCNQDICTVSNEDICITHSVCNPSVNIYNNPTDATQISRICVGPVQKPKHL